MRSELQFLQSEADESEFVEEFAKQADALETESKNEWRFRVGDCHIQFLRSQRPDGVISLGRIAIATHGFGFNYVFSAKAEAVYNRMRRWLKTRYHNRLRVENPKIPGSTTSYRNLWLGPDAAQLYRKQRVVLKSISNGHIVIREDTADKDA